MRIKHLVLFLALVLGLGACDDPRKGPQAWVVLDLNMPDGTSAQVAFENRPVFRSVKECKRELEKVVPKFMEVVHQQPDAEGAELTHARCVMSLRNPVRAS